MIHLILETATLQGFVALYHGEKPLGESLLPLGLRSSQFLFAEMDALLKGCDVTPSEVGLVTCGVGPGSYTGIRVAATVAKTLSYSHSIPLVGLSSLSAFVPNECSHFYSLLDAKIGGLYLQGEEGAPQLLSWEQAEPRLRERSLFTPDAALIAKLEKRGFTAEHIQPSIAFFASQGLEAHQQGRCSTKGDLDLIYLRKTQPEEELKSMAEGKKLI